LPIRFLGEQAMPGFWEGLFFNTNSPVNELTHVEVAHAGGGGGSNPANVTVGSFDRLRLTNSLIRNSAGVGLHVGGSAVLPGFGTNVLRDNGAAGMQLPLDLLGSLDTATDYTRGNGVGYLDVYSASVSAGQTWRITGAPIRLTGSSTIWEPVVVVPGVSFLLGAGADLTVAGTRGSLSAVGTAAAPIRFLGEQAMPGYWEGLFFHSDNAANELTHVEVAHAGGGGGSNPANVTVGSFDRLRLTNSLIRNSAGWGLFVQPSGMLVPGPALGAGNAYISNALGNSNVP